MPSAGFSGQCLASYSFSVGLVYNMFHCIQSVMYLTLLTFCTISLLSPSHTALPKPLTRVAPFLSPPLMRLYHAKPPYWQNVPPYWMNALRLFSFPASQIGGWPRMRRCQVVIVVWLTTNRGRVCREGAAVNQSRGRWRGGVV